MTCRTGTPWPSGVGRRGPGPPGMSTIDPLRGLDPVVTAPKRLAIVALLSRASTNDFGFLRDHLRTSDSDLSKQMSARESAGYVSVTSPARPW